MDHKLVTRLMDAIRDVAVDTAPAPARHPFQEEILEAALYVCLRGGYGEMPMQIADTLGALARACEDEPDLEEPAPEDPERWDGLS